MATIQSKRVFDRIDVDKDELRLDTLAARFIKNLTKSVKRNIVGSGANQNVATPIQSLQNYTQVKIPYPDGINKTCGFYEAKETNEAYIFIHNSNSEHMIYRIRGNDGSVQVVYKKNCLPFKDDPAYFISEGRAWLHNDTFIDKSDNTRKPRKLLLFTTNYKDICCISVEDSIETNSFNETDYPLFDVVGYDECELIRLGLPTPSQCIAITPVPRETDDKKQNLLSYKGWQFRIKFIDVFGRESEWGIISDRYFTIVGAGCISNSSGLSRCITLEIEAGGPLIDKIQLAYHTCSGNSGLSGDGDWYLYDTILKYNNCDSGKWYDRTVRNPWKVKYDERREAGDTIEEAEAAAAGLLKFDRIKNTFLYTFCNDKECQLIPQSETSRTQNPIPFESSGLFAIDNVIGLANNRRGWTPLDCNVLDKFGFSAVPPAGGECGEDDQKLRKIVVYAWIYNPFLGEPSLSRKSSGVPCFGRTECNKNNPLSYDQVFASGQEGFPGYLVGTEHFSISTQVFHAVGQTDQVIGLEGIPDNLPLFVQKFEFNVPPGKYIFRIGSHLADVSTAEYQKTSTYVKSLHRWNSGTPVLLKDEIKEMIIDVCTEDYLSDGADFPLLTIYDLTSDASDAKISLNDCWANATTVIDGYMLEDQVTDLPVEYAECELVTRNGASEKYSCKYTDHNGFYFGAAKAKKTSMQVKVYHCVGGDASDHWTARESREGIDNFNSGGHLRHDTLYVIEENEEFPIEGRRIIKGKILLCGDNQIGIQGVLVCVTKGQPTFTDAQGNFTIYLHNRTGDFANSPDNKDTVIISQKGLCKLTTCEDECLSCFTDYLIDYIDCAEDRTTTLADLRVNISGVNRLGPQTGGRYGLGITMYDWMGRHSFIQAADHFYVDIPSLLDTKVFSFSTIQWSLDMSVVFPPGVAYFTISITENQNLDDFLMWSVDKVEFVDAGGNINNVAPTQIRIYYESISEFNKQNNFATTTNWQFIETLDDKEKSVIGDQIQFLINGDGKWFDKTITSIVRHDKDGKYATIDYTEDLKDLVEGGLIKLIRPKACVEKYIYHEICPKIKVDSQGKPDIYGGNINYYDSYFLNRQIPVPVRTKTTVNGQEVENLDIVTKSYEFSFEHPSPSDLWGNKCKNGGRINVKNPYEREQRMGTEIALSKAITENSAFNGLSYFDDTDVQVFEKQEWGNITVVLPEVNLILVICEKDSFVVAYSESDIKIGGDGVLVSQPARGIFARPQRKIGKNFGCQPQDINTIRKIDGVVMFLDRNKAAIVMHGYGDAESISDSSAVGGYKTWVRTKLAWANANNLASADKVFFHGGIDPNTKEYYLTAFKRSASPSYANLQEGWSKTANETICIDVNTGEMNCAVGFTPEYYGSLEGFYAAKNMFSFTQGIAWIHHIIDGAFSACNFYGFQDKKIFTVVYNDNAEKVKRALWNEVYCKEHKFIAYIRTETGQESRILASHWKKGERFWFASFPCAVNTAFDPGLPAVVRNNPLYSGEVLSGRWIEVTYMSDAGDHDDYCEVSATQAFLMEVERSG